MRMREVGWPAGTMTIATMATEALHQDDLPVPDHGDRLHDTTIDTGKELK